MAVFITRSSFMIRILAPLTSTSWIIRWTFFVVLISVLRWLSPSLSVLLRSLGGIVWWSTMLGENPLAPQVIPGLGGIPLKLEVSITPSDEVQALRQQVSDLTLQLSQLQARYNRAEYLYRCETLINQQLVDLCKVEGVNIPKRLFQRPFEEVH